MQYSSSYSSQTHATKKMLSFRNHLLRRGLSTSSRFSEVLNSLREDGAIKVSTNIYERERHSKGESHHKSPYLPTAVIYPRNTKAVSQVVKLCNDEKIPIVPFGAGTSIEGHVCCMREKSIAIDLTRLDNVYLNDDGMLNDFHVRVGSGVHRLRLNEEIRHTGMQFMVDPGADATIGGMVATGASGTSAVKFGTMRQNVLALEAVLADGSIVKCGTNARKSSAGYDLVGLLCGSEGTLGIITEVTVKLWPILPCITSAVCIFDTLHEAAEAVAALLQSGIPVDRCEILDSNSIEAFNRYSSEVDALPLKPHLFLDFSGPTEASVDAFTDLARSICSEDFSCSDFRFTSDDAKRASLWSARHQLYYASLALRPGASGIVTDVCVPLSQLANVIQATADDVKELDVVGPCFGHAGDGNFHCILPILDSDTEDYLSRVEEVNTRLINRAILAGGTVTGEHGVGYGKIKYLSKLYGDNTVKMMGMIKRSLDPNNIMNPGKVISL